MYIHDHVGLALGTYMVAAPEYYEASSQQKGNNSADAAACRLQHHPLRCMPSSDLTAADLQKAIMYALH